MAVSEQARRTHDELFPGHVSTLAVTDPELIESFDNFALASLIACQAVSEYRVMLGAALTVGVTPVSAGVPRSQSPT